MQNNAPRREKNAARGGDMRRGRVAGLTVVRQDAGRDRRYAARRGESAISARSAFEERFALRNAPQIKPPSGREVARRFAPRRKELAQRTVAALRSVAAGDIFKERFALRNEFIEIFS